MADLKELKVKVTFDMASLNKSAAELKSTLSRIASDLSKSIKIDLSNAIDTRSISNLKNNIQNQLSGINVGIKADVERNSNSNSNNTINNSSNNVGSTVGGLGSMAGAAGIVGASSGIKDASSGIKDAGNTLIAGGRSIENGAISVKSTIEGFNVVIRQLEKALFSLSSMSSSLDKIKELNEIESYTKNALAYMKKIDDISKDFGNRLNNLTKSPISLSKLDIDEFYYVKDISDAIVNNFRSLGDTKFFNSDSVKTLMNDLEAANNKFKNDFEGFINLSNLNRNSFNSNQAFGGPDPSIDAFIKQLTEDLVKATESQKNFAMYTREMVSEARKHLDLLPPSMDRIKEEAAVLESAMVMKNTPESGVAILNALDNIEQKYKGTISSIKMEDIGKILKDKFNFGILDNDAIREFGNNFSAVIDYLEQDESSFRITAVNDINTVAEAFNLNAGRIALAMREIMLPVNAIRTANNPIAESMNQVGASVQNSTGRLNQFFNLLRRGNDIPNDAYVGPFDRLRERIRSCSSTLKEFFNTGNNNTIKSSLDQFSNSAKNFKSSLKELVSSVKQLFGQNDQTTNNNIDKMDKKAKNTHSTIKGLVKSLAGMFGLYKIFAIFKQGTSDAIKYEALLMQIQKRFGYANNALEDFINNQAVMYGLSKRQAAEFGNIYSVFVNDIIRGAQKSSTLKDLLLEKTGVEDLKSANAEITADLLKAAGTIASATGYDMDYVVQGLRSGIMG